MHMEGCMELKQERNAEMDRMWGQVQAADRRVQAATDRADVRTITVVLEGARVCGALPEEFVARLLRAGGAL